MNQPQTATRQTQLLQYPQRRRFAFTLSVLIGCLSVLLPAAHASAQDQAQSKDQDHSTLRERYVPADELDTVFARDTRGVMLKRSELNELLQQARSNAAAAIHPAPLVIKQARYRISLADQQAKIEAELDVQQFADGWQLIRIPAGNLAVEQALINKEPAILARDPADRSTVLLAHRQPGAFTAVISFSTPLVAAGIERLAAFQLPQVAAVELLVECPADRRLLVNDRQLDRPGDPAQPAEYRVPAGGAPEVRLRWTARQQESQAETLAFVHSEALLEFRPEVTQWSGESQVSVFGGTLNRITARVPAGFEVVHAESTGLEAWQLEDDPEQPGRTRLTLTWRQPFSGDRSVVIRGVAMTPPDAASEPRPVPAIEFINVASHSGRLLLRQSQGLRLVAETESGIRPVSAFEVSAPAEAQVFDFWQQQYRMTAAVRPRSRELFADNSNTLEIRDTETILNTALTIEVLNAPLFEFPLTLPPDWQLTAVSSAGNPVPWTAGSTPTDIVVRPPSSIQPGELFKLQLLLQKSLPDPETEQRLLLPAVHTPGLTSVGGIWTIQTTDDLVAVPLTTTGLTPLSGSGSQQLFRNDGTPVSGELSISRKPARIASRSVLRTWADMRQQTVSAEVTVDVLSGTLRSLELRLPEALGADVRFNVAQVGVVPGLDMPRNVEPVEIAEQSAGPVENGLRPFTLRLSRRFAGSLMLITEIPRPRDPGTALTAPLLQVVNAIRQPGLLVFEAAPDQSLAAPPAVASIPGLFPADASLVTPPDPVTSRRIALAWRFIRPDYAFQVTETRFDSTPVPSAVCEHLESICTINESGSLQRKVNARLQASGVQTLRFKLPDGERSSLWSTILNGDAVEVRETDGDYLVALPAASDNTEINLTLLFETAPPESGDYRSSHQRPVQFSIDAQNQQAVLIDVLRQTWQVHYPETDMIVDASGPFRAADGLDDAGWLQSLSRWQLPDWKALLPQLFAPAILLLALFVLTTLVVQRRWKFLGGLAAATLIGLLLLLPAWRGLAPGQRQTDSVAVPGFPPGDGGWEADALPPQAPAGSMGGGGMGGFGGGGMGGLGAAAAPVEGRDMLFAEPQSLPDAAKADLSPNAITDAPALAPTEPAPAEVRLSDAAGLAADAAPAPAAAPERLARKGARLSVNVDLEIPDDYRNRTFISVADSTQGPAVLQLALRSRTQLFTLRAIAAVAVLLLAFSLRRRHFSLQLAICLALLLLALAAVPLVPSAWQGLVDGAALAAAVAAGMATAIAMSGLCCGPYCPLTWCRQHCLPRRFSSAATTTGTAVGIVFAVVHLLAAPASAQEPVTAPPADTLPEIIVPWTADQPPLRADRVFIPHDQFLKLFALARPGVLPKADTNPLGSGVVSAWLRTLELRPVEEERHSLGFEARFAVWCDSTETSTIALPLGPVGIRSVKVNGEDGVTVPLISGVGAAPLPDFAGQQIPQSKQQQVAGNVAPPADAGPAYAVQLTGRRLHVVDVVFEVAAEVQGALGRADLPLRSPVAGMLEWTLPADGLDARVNGRSSGFRQTGRTVTVPVALASTLRLQWLPAQQKAAGDVLYHAETTSAVAVQDSGLLLRTAVAVAVRQGEISELDVSLPDDYSLQTVTGDDLAGWSIQDTDNGRSLRIPLRRSVTDNTQIVFQMFAPLPAPELLQKFPVPVSVVRGAGRDAGSVVLLTGTQFQVRSDALSGVSQLNPDEAPQPAGDALPGRPLLAWRYTRQPASIAVRISPTTDEQTVQAVHAIRLEQQRQLWASRFTVLLKGSSRSRIDLTIPRSFLPLDVTAPGLSDWYLTDSPEPDAAVRTLSIQLDDSRTGTLQIVLQGQQPRDADRQQLTLQPPALLNSTSTESQLAVWLDAASENAGLDQDGGWTLQPVTSATADFREIAPSQPAVLFRSNQTQPGTVVMRLRPAVSTLIAESVTVSSITPASREVLLGLKWQIARAAADQFAVELPETLAAAMTFDVPGQRRIQRESAAPGVTRIVFQLQQPAADQIFILGTASLPLPADGRLQPALPAFIVPANTPATLSGQSHFHVVVNQSSALLQPEQEQPDDVVTPEQLTTRIPQALLEQAVRITRLHAGTAAWKISYPEQQKVAPAVVSLATHTTVLADDGSWRSRHQLRVVNESRQFLPIMLPENCRLLFCVVAGQPSRVVISESSGRRRHLIPIPQSGHASTGFDVDFALAGRFDENGAALRKRLAAQTLTIPVPAFPEFRDDPEQGISISRNRWSIHVPESWRAVVNRNPALTNVVPAAVAELQDAEVLSEVEQALSFFGSSTRDGLNPSAKLSGYLQLNSRLQQLRGNSAAAEQARFDALQRLQELEQSETPADQSGGQAQGFNQFLYEQDRSLNRNAENSRNWFFSDNSIALQGQTPGTTGAADGGRQSGGQVDRFEFRFTMPEKPASDKVAEDRTAPPRAAGERGAASQQRSLDGKFGRAAADEAAKAKQNTNGAANAPAPQSRLRRQLAEGDLLSERLVEEKQAAEKRVETETLRKEMRDTPQSETQLGLAIPAPGGGGAPGAPAILPPPAPASGEAMQDADDFSAATPAAEPQGRLSLLFELPADGLQMDFLRVGGNPALALDVRSADSVRTAGGLIWAVACSLAALVLLTSGLRGRLLPVLQTTSLVLFLLALSLLCTSSPTLQAASIPLVLAAAVLFAATRIARAFQSPVSP
ncbi:MAG: hypothetical protein ACKO2L_20895 [Planctomycetaceae bacterium]